MMQLLKHLLLGLFIVPSLLFSSDGLFGAKKIYKAFSNTIKSSTDIVRTTMNMEVAGDIVRPLQEEVISPQERKSFLQEQFTPQKELLDLKIVHTENINIEIEAIQFFDSLNRSVKKPINIE